MNKVEEQALQIKESKIKVLSLGSGQANFLGQLYSEIKLQANNISFDIDGLKKFSDKVDNNEKIAFDHFFDFKRNITTSDRLRCLVKVIFNKVVFISLVNIILFETNKLKKVGDKLLDFLTAKAVVDKYLKKSNYDVFHFQFCIPPNLIYLYFLPKNKKIICSLWGSDLLRRSGANDYYLQLEALKRASIITTQSPELGEVILAKFGRSLKPKIRHALFSIEPRLYNLIDCYRNSKTHITAFQERMGISSSYIITVGHNASFFNNHLQILEQLNTLDKEIKGKLVCILPFTYGASDNSYIDKVDEFCKRMDFKCILLQDYLSWDDMALLRLSTDIMIHMPESDAMSGAATEAMYAGSLLITGAWLPYGNFRRSGLSFLEIKAFDDLPAIITQYITGNSLYNESAAVQNQENIKKYFFPAATVRPWINIYHELTHERKIIE
jgi:hypothetical protein